MQEIEFDEWFDLFVDYLRRLGYNGPIDKHSFEDEFEAGKAPEESASEFFNEINE